MSGNALGFLLGTEDFCARFIHRVVVEVAHYNHTHVRIHAPQTVRNCFAQFCCLDAVWFAFFLAANARRPVVYDDGYALSHQPADDAHLVACAERYGRGAVVGNILHSEVCWIVDKAHVNASGVGGIVVYIFQLPLGKLGLVYHILDYRCVFDFADTDNRRTYGSGASGKLTDCICQIMHFLAVLGTVPLSLSVGSELGVPAFGIVWNGIEKVLEIIESDAGNLYLAVVLRGGGYSDAKNQHCDTKENSAYAIHGRTDYSDSGFILTAKIVINN